MTVTSTTTVPTQVLNIIMSYVSPVDDYVIYSGDNYTYYGYVTSITGNQIITVRRTGTTNYVYNVSVSDTSVSVSDISVTYPYYTYSNVSGKGVYMASPHTQTVICYAVVITCVLITVTMIFGRVFSWAKRR